MHDRTGGEQNNDERHGLHRPSCRQRVTAQVLAPCDEADTFYLLLRFCLVSFAKGAPFVTGLPCERGACHATFAGGARSARSCDSSLQRGPLRTPETLPAEALYSSSGRHEWCRECQRVTGAAASPGTTRPTTLLRVSLLYAHR